MNEDFMLKKLFLLTVLLVCVPFKSESAKSTPDYKSYSGIYPHLTFFNREGECGIGAVVPWNNSLWAITYGPHLMKGSSDKLYQITDNLDLIVRKESVGGTNANRMIHKESEQLFIGRHAIDKKGVVRTIHGSKMFGRLTANARHLTDPQNKIYFASMEEAIYEVDVKTLKVKTLFRDEQVKGRPKASLPGYHGKGLYSGQGKLIYANNGENSKNARRNPFVDSGCLASWDPKSSKKWKVVLRRQFTEVTGPGGIYGNENPETDPVWSIGWDAKSLILMLLDGGKWHRFRLPKSSHSYDGAHGWNTEWPRIREIGEENLLMTMHGMFWHFPKTFTKANTKGIRPRSSYLKVVGDFCKWKDHVVLGCDDTAKNEFLNKRKAKGHLPQPQSQSNLWFLKPEQLDTLGASMGRGAVWLNEDIPAGKYSDPFLFSGFSKRGLHLSHKGEEEVTITIEVNHGNTQWAPLKEVTLPKKGYVWTSFPLSQEGVWLRLKSDKALKNVRAWFEMSNKKNPSNNKESLFTGITTTDHNEQLVGGSVFCPRSR